MLTRASAGRHASRARRTRGAHSARRRRTPLRLVLDVAVRLAFAGLVAIGIGLAAIVLGPRFLPYQALIVRSGSMAPTIPTGSVVFYRQEPANEVQVGQVILFQEPGTRTFVTHRVHQIVTGNGGREFVTKGDANGVPDPWRIPAIGEGWVAVFHVPDVGYVLSSFSGSWARICLLTVPALALGLITLAEALPRRRRLHSTAPGS